MSSITVLHTLNNRPACKTWTQQPSGNFTGTPYNAGTYFSVEVRPVSDIHILSSLLTELESDPHRFLIRAVVHEGADFSKVMRRQIYRQGADPESINECPFVDREQPWLMVDIDRLALPEGAHVLSDARNAIEYAISLLPPEFHQVSYHWQLSASTGIKAHDRLSVHLWFWLTNPISSYDLRQWAHHVNSKQGLKLIDYALFNAVQPHYTANPIFIPSEADPVSVRSGFVEKAETAVTLALPTKEEAETLYTTGAGQGIKDWETHGYENILENMGDYPGGDGFHGPLLRATASIVATKGEEWVLSHLDSIIQDLQERIDWTEKSPSRGDDIKRYRSREYLEDNLKSAIGKKFGKERVKAQPYYNSQWLSIEEGTDRLQNELLMFLSEVHNFHQYGEKYPGPTPNLAIKATAGLGKTSQVIKWAMTQGIFNDGKHLEYYVPNHALSAQLEADVRTALEEAAKELQDTPIKPWVKTILGRNRKLENDVPVCFKAEAADRLAKAGINVQSHLCANSLEQCDAFNSCAYQKQFRPLHEIDKPQEPLFIPAVSILTHDHLFLTKRDELPKPALVIVDESFWQKGIERYELRLTELGKSDSPYLQQIFYTLIKGIPLLKMIRQQGITPTDLRKEADSLDDADKGSGITPGMKENDLQKKLNDLRPPSKLPVLLNQLAEELEMTDRDEAHSVILGTDSKGEDRMIVHRRREMNIPGDIPMLFIDADINRQLLQLFRPDTPIAEIPVERQAIVHQFNKTFSKFSLKDEDKNLFDEVQDFIRRVGQKGKTVVATNKEIRCLLTGESGQDLPAIGNFEGIPVIHYVKLRGLNDFEGYGNVIVLGREQPPAEAMEQQAMALWWDDPQPVQKVAAKENGSRPYLNQPRGYCTRNGIVEDDFVQIHPDSRVQILLEQARESECLQAVDRLRLLRKREGEPQNVFLLTSIPLDITVDHFHVWDQIQRVIRLYDKSNGFLPLAYEDMIKVLPDEGLTEDTVRAIRETVKNGLSLIQVLINKTPFLIRYSTSPSARKPKQALTHINIESLLTVIKGLPGITSRLTNEPPLPAQYGP